MAHTPHRSFVFTTLTAVGLLVGCNDPAKSTRSAQPDSAMNLATQTSQFVNDFGQPQANAEHTQVQWVDPSAQTTATPSRDPAPRPIAYNPRRVELDPPQPVRFPEPDPVAPTHTTIAAPPAPKALTTQQLVGRLGQKIDEAAKDDDSLRPWLNRAALSVFDPTKELTASDLSSLTEDQRRTVLAYQRTFTQIAHSSGQSADDDRQLLIDAAHELADQLAGEQPLSIRNLKLCNRVKGYGVYDEFASSTFLVGRSHPAIVYAELDHFRTQATDDGKHRVKLTQDIVLYNESDGLPVWRQDPAVITDESHNIRRDFFVVQIIRLSDRLSVGKYMLKVTLTDEIGKTVDEATLPIQIVADPGMIGAQ